MAGNQEEAVKRALQKCGGDRSHPDVQKAYGAYVRSMEAHNQRPKDLRYM